MEIICGIYAIENKINKKLYIGYSADIKKRWRYHLSYLEKNNHQNTYLQRSWNKYGKNNFEFYIIEECSRDLLIQKEKYYIKELNTFFLDGYNFNRGGQGNKDWIPSPEPFKRKPYSP